MYFIDVAPIGKDSIIHEALIVVRLRDLFSNYENDPQ